MRRHCCKHSSPATFDGEPCKLSSDSHEAMVVQRESGHAQKGELGCGHDDFKECRWVCLTRGWSRVGTGSYGSVDREFGSG